MYKILIVEDDLSLSKGIELALRSEKYEFKTAHLIKEAREFIQNQKVDLMILDLNLPDGNGLKFMGEVRQNCHFPIIILTAQDMEIDIVTGLEMGADDYITKPFSLMVLRARVHAALRKYGVREDKVIHIEPFNFDFEKMVFAKKGKWIELSKTEQKLLRLLVMNRGRVMARGDLVDKVWGDGAEYVDENALSVTIKRLRDKLEDEPSKPKFIKNVYGVGYTWTVQGEEN